VNQLACEIGCANSAPDKRKGYCFQRAVALELINAGVSKLWDLIIKSIADVGFTMSPVPVTSRKILMFAQDSDVVQDRVCLSQDIQVPKHKKTDKTKTGKNKTGDVAGLRARDGKGNLWDIKIEAKNSLKDDYLQKGLEKFFQLGEKRSSTHEIYVYLSLFAMCDHPTLASHASADGTKIFLLIHGLHKDDCTLDIHFLSNPNPSGITLQELVQKLSPPNIPPKISGAADRNVDLGGTERGMCLECKAQCPRYLSQNGIDCVLCGHKAAQHQNLQQKTIS